MATAVDIGELVGRKAGVLGGRPVITGTRIAVSRVAVLAGQGYSPEEIADYFGHLNLAQIHAALAYYHANSDEIEAEIARESSEAARLEEEHVAKSLRHRK